jgi:hypothetical protein
MDRSRNQSQDSTLESGTFINRLRNSVETRTGKAAAAVLITMGALTLSACGSERGTASEPTTTESSEPNAQPTETAETPTETPENDIYTAETLEQTTSYEEMLDMSVQDYANLPFADRFAFTYEQSQRSSPFDDLSMDLMSEDPESIPDLFWEPSFATSTNHPDPDVRAKFAGAYRYYTTLKGTDEISESYQAVIDEVVAKGGEGISVDYVYNATDHGELQHGTDRDGNPIDFMNITYKAGSGLEDAPNYYANNEEQTAQAIRTEIKLLDGTEGVFYAIGYGVDGRISPDDRYPY